MSIGGVYLAQQYPQYEYPGQRAISSNISDNGYVTPISPERETIERGRNPFIRVSGQYDPVRIFQIYNIHCSCFSRYFGKARENAEVIQSWLDANTLTSDLRHGIGVVHVTVDLVDSLGEGQLLAR